MADVAVVVLTRLRGGRVLLCGVQQLQSGRRYGQQGNGRLGPQVLRVLGVVGSQQSAAAGIAGWLGAQPGRQHAGRPHNS